MRTEESSTQDEKRSDAAYASWLPNKDDSNIYHWIVTYRGNRYILVVSDYFTKWTEAFPMPNMEAQTVAKLIVHDHLKIRVLNVPHPLQHGPTVYNGHLRGPVTLTTVAERLAVDRTPISRMRYSLIKSLNTMNQTHLYHRNIICSSVICIC